MLSSECGISLFKIVEANERRLAILKRDITYYTKRNEELDTKIKLIKKENDVMKNSPTKEEYELAMETIEKYEKRQSDLKYLNKLLGEAIQQFQTTKFEVNKAAKKVEFIGLTKDGKLKHTVSQARGTDIFEEVIGKLVAIYRAAGQDVEFLEEYIEQEPDWSVFKGFANPQKVWFNHRGGKGSTKIKGDNLILTTPKDPRFY